MSAATRWAAVVVNYEAGPLLVDCVRSLLADTSTGGPPAVVVVDNASSDDSVAALRAALPAVRVLEAGTNLGYAGAANLGIAGTDTPVVAVCNPDLRVAPGTAAALVGRLAAEADLGAVGPAVLEPDGSRYPSARRFPSTLDAVGHGTLSRAWPENPFTRRYRALDVDGARPATWTGSPAPRCGCGEPPSTRSVDGTSATSCTWKTSTCAGGCGGPDGGSRTSRPARSCTSRGSAPTGTRTG